MKSVIFYNSHDIFYNKSCFNTRAAIPGADLFADIFSIFNSNITFFDRTNSITVPINCTLLDNMALPTITNSTISFDDICDLRTVELLNKAKTSGRKLAIMYSGGVDSTLILCSLLKNASKEDLKNVVVLMSMASILENPTFYYSHVIKYFNCVPSHRFQYYLGNDDFLFVSGENADQLFGSQLVAPFVSICGPDKLYGPLDSSIDKLKDFFISMLPEHRRKYASKLLEILLYMTSKAPIKIDTIYKFFWWINFATKWQSVYVRILGFTKLWDTLKLEDNYTTFYSIPEFQIWSMINSDIHGDPSKPYKSVPKKYIIDINGDHAYINKPKIGSLANIIMRKEAAFGITPKLELLSEYPSMDYFNFNNSFI